MDTHTRRMLRLKLRGLTRMFQRSRIRRVAALASFVITASAALGVMYHFTLETRAVAGDYAVYRETTGLESIAATPSDQAWDTTVNAAGLFSIDGARTNITLSEAGHYLALYNVGTEIVTGTSYAEVQGYFFVNGTQSPYGRASCTILNQDGHTKCWMFGAAIIETTATNQAVKVQAQRTDSASGTFRRNAGDSGVTLVRLDDGWEFARVREAGGGQSFNGGWTTVSFDTNDELDTAMYSRTDGDITLAEAGRYLVTSQVHFLSNESSKTRAQGTRLTLDGTEVPGTRVTANLPAVNSTQDAVASYVGVIETTATNQVLQLQGACLSEDCDKITNAANGSAITIVKLADTVETVSLSETIGGQQVYATDDPVTWDTQDDISSSFTHSTGSNTSRITVNEDDDYLFLSSVYAESTDTSSAVVMNPHIEWRKNGSTVLPYGSADKALIGDDGLYGVFIAGLASGAVYSGLTAGDYVEAINTNETSGTLTGPTFQGGIMALHGIRLSTLQEPDITVSAVGNQFATTTIPSNDFYLGGAFAFVANHTFPTETITSVTLTETGTVDAANDLSDIRLYYEFDVNSPFDCAAESYDGTELQFGATSSAFSGANGTTTFNGSAIASSSQTACMYVVLNVDSTADTGDSIDIEISNPTTDVVLGGGPVGPNVSVALTGSTTLEDDLLTQTHYHWRLDNGNEGDTVAGADSATGGLEDTVLDSLNKSTPRRIRMQVSNEGTAISPATQYRIEYAQRSSGSCALTAAGWTDVDAVGGAWDMFNSGNLTNGNDTTNISLGSKGAVTDENTQFLGTNGGVRTTTSQSGALTLSSTQFVEFEYSVVATASAVDGESYCFRLTDAGTPLPSYLSYPEVSIAADVLVAGTGAHTSAVDASTTDLYIGGAWVIEDLAASRTVSSITLSESGTVDAANDLSNIRVYYEFDTVGALDCAAETYDGTELQYGATSSAFSAANGTSVFVDSAVISTTSTMCLYAVLDIGPNAGDGETVQLSIANPGADVVVSGGSVNPNTLVGPTGSTTIQKAFVEQTHYHWRNDDGTEVSASSATGGNEDSPMTNVKRTETERLRISVSNEGSTSTTPTVYTLEYVERSGSCAASSGWAPVGQPGSAWAMSNSTFLTDGNSTTNILEAAGGVTDENVLFLDSNFGVRDTQATTSSVVMGSTTFAEFEFALEATTEAGFGSTYCFRLAAEGTPVSTYTHYPQATIRQNQDFFIQRGFSTIANNDTTVTIVAGTDYVAPSATSSSFIRITNTLQTGAGRAALGGNQNADNVTAYISNPDNVQTSVTFTRQGDVDSTRIYWEVIEYTGPTGGDNEMVVHDAQAFIMGNQALTETIAVPGVTDDADVVVFLTGQGNNQANLTGYDLALVTTDWDGVNDEVVLERAEYAGGSGNPAYVSFAVVEFTGSNWAVQRAEHTYTAAGTTETETIADVNDLSRAFVHAQKRTSEGNVADLGHMVWLSSVGQVSFVLNYGAATPANHTSVAWIVENTQTNGTPMDVTRVSSGQAAGGAEASLYSIPIGKTLADEDTASIFTTVAGGGATVNHPRAIMGATIASTTHFELWISDTGSARNYNSQIVEWPTAELTIIQNYYRFYVADNSLDPSDPWPPGGTDLGENTAITGDDVPLGNGERIRIRMALSVSGSNISQGSQQFQLEYGARVSTCGAISDWFPIGETSSTTAAWRGHNASPADGTVLSTDPPAVNALNLSVSDVAGTYEESNPTALNPYKITIGDDVEYDWNIEAYDVTDQTSYCFRMVESDGGRFDSYAYYPTLRTSGYLVEQFSWQWYGDEGSLTPSVSLAASNTAPSNIAYEDPLKLRVVLSETAGDDGDNAKFKLQWSESSDFAVVQDVVDIDSCTPGTPWCYSDGAGADNATITEKVLADADACTGGLGVGCGTRNELSYAPQIIGEVGTSSTDSAGTVINLQHTYADPVFIVESVSGDATGGAGNDPAAAIITATTTSSFTVRIQEPDNEVDDHGVEEFAYIVMERGAHTLPDGRRVDVDTLDTAAYYGNAVAGGSSDTCTFTQSFDHIPAIYTALQTNNNTGAPDFLTVSQAVVTANDFLCAIEVPDGEVNAPGSNETIGWIAIEQGAFTNNSIDIVASSTVQSVDGWTDTPWYTYSFPENFFTGIPGVLASRQTRVGAEGGWARFDNSSNEAVQLAIDERDDGERTHASEALGLLAISEGGVLYDDVGDSGFTFDANANKEFEFTIVHTGADPNTTYFFRLYDYAVDAEVPLHGSSTNPSLSTEGTQLTFTISGFAASTSIEGITTVATTTATSVPFGVLPLGVDRAAAQRLTVSTNATQGYQVLALERGDLESANGATISDVTGTNAAPLAWSTVCSIVADSCFGYHVGDNTLSGGSTRFLSNDTYAALTSTPSEVAYSSAPVTSESTDIVYRIQANPGQTAGQYESKVVFVVVPVY